MSSGLIDLLKIESCQPYALTALHDQVDQYWSELANHLPILEKMYLSSKVDQLALLISKIYFHLDVHDMSLQYALKANLSEKSLFVNAIIQNAVESYIELSLKNAPIDPLLSNMIELIVKDAMSTNDVNLVIDMAIKSQDLTLLKRCISPQSIAVIYDLCLHTTFSTKVFPLIVKEFLANDNYQLATQCYLQLNLPVPVAELLAQLLLKDKLLAYQIAFDLEQLASQSFLTLVIAATNDTELVSILNGKKSLLLYLEFMYRTNKGDLQLLTHCKEKCDSRNSIHHNALSICNAYLFAGTTYDQFLRDNLEWLSKANLWSKFTAIAALGVLHKGQHTNAMTILEPYLPQQVSTEQHSESGSLLALGLIYVKHAQPSITTIFENQLNSSEVLQHGATLGLGCTMLGSQDETVYSKLKSILYSDSCIAGQSAAMSIGLVMIGSNSTTIINELMQYCQDTEHDTICRSLSVAIGLCHYEQTSELPYSLLNHVNPFIRMSGCWGIAMSKLKTGDNHAIQTLLTKCTSDVNDDVRRTAVIALGFVLLGHKQQCIDLMDSLITNHHSFVRYGACIALGMVLSNTNNIDLLEHVLKDPVDIVRQSAYIALGMITQNCSATSTNGSREVLLKVIQDKREHPMAKLGALMGLGIMEGGGRNVFMSTHSIENIVGLVLFTQYWYWYPYSLFLSLTFTPMALIGLNKDLQVPQFECKVNAKPSLYAYPKKLVVEEKKQVALKSAILSVNKRRHTVDMDVVPTEVVDKVEKKVEEEPNFFKITNMSRMMPDQPVEMLSTRYTPLGPLNGIVMLRDKENGVGEELIEMTEKSIKAIQLDAEERSLPTDIDNPFKMQE